MADRLIAAAAAAGDSNLVRHETIATEEHVATRDTRRSYARKQRRSKGHR